MKKIIILFSLVLILIIIITYRYVYKGHRDISTEKESYTITVTDIFSEFQENEVLSNAKYLDKTIQVTGIVSSANINSNSILIDDKLFVALKDKLPKSFQLKSTVKIKGRFIGYDSLLEELKMDQCVLITQ
ncbi:OB-fold protein [Flavobacterium cellulosilyticum]|uniref:tRNA_anti-like n=1 Tax=Flavobacterium cellulosilyticum TaxID=2541731 RepID=A0A4R5CIY7_9FLAO|nr:hypothetical protein [Flavobacterium cellulosilyticum]TDD97342.1 hypothetical protein E0F76_08480 [Flavobacterium cellulosilyticum]